MSIKEELEAFSALQGTLEANHMGRWVLIHNRALVEAYSSFEAAAADAVQRFGSGPFLIRQVGAPPVTLPISVLYHRMDAQR